MQVKEILHDYRDIDALVRAARLHPTESMIEKMIDLEVDYDGNFVGYNQANIIWRSLLNRAA